MDFFARLIVCKVRLAAQQINKVARHKTGSSKIYDLETVTVNVWRIGKFEQLFRKTKFLIGHLPAHRILDFSFGARLLAGSASLGSHF
ncbi:MAG: hypothetical protein CM15mP46_1990 [Alphaproteobacteria bacterium]|nr:MAG: hypothetical protein CM15mP46_1990 [Alphaproteobacteria bacterium]